MENEFDFFSVINVNEIPDGERIFIDLDDEPVVIFRVSGKFYAISDRCSHDDGPLGDGELDGCEVVCPRHGARFDIRTGEVKSMPAIEDINWYPTRIVGDMLEIGVRR
jgi:3-phenylpropionate/trans-cinnamate dioxygenase ferredoxin subunit